MACVLALTAGCGGASHSGDSSNVTSGPVAHAKGTVALTIKWPLVPVTPHGMKPRLVPEAAQSIGIVLSTADGTVLAQQVAIHPAGQSTSTATFPNLPSVSVTVAATAYPSADGTGTALATGSVAVLVHSGDTTPASVTMGSNIHHLALTPATPSLAIGATVTLSVTALDAAGDLMLTTATKLQWVSSDPMLATVDENGMVTGVAVGTPIITVTDTESGKSGSLSVSVVKSIVDHITITVSGPYPAPNLQLVATAYDALNNVIPIQTTQYAWSSSDDTVETVDANGLTSTLGQIGQSAVITATDSVSGKSGEITVIVVPLDKSNLRSRGNHSMPLRGATTVHTTSRKQL